MEPSRLNLVFHFQIQTPQVCHWVSISDKVCNSIKRKLIILQKCDSRYFVCVSNTDNTMMNIYTFDKQGILTTIFRKFPQVFALNQKSEKYSSSNCQNQEIILVGLNPRIPGWQHHLGTNIRLQNQECFTM